MMAEFTIDKVAWHSSVKGNPEKIERIIDRFWVLTVFLRQNNLLRHDLAISKEGIGDDYKISSDDLNDLGMCVIKCGYDKWLKKLNKGGPVDDVAILSRCLISCKNKNTQN